MAARSARTNTAPRRRTNQRGASLVEFAVGAVVFLLLLFGVIEFGRGYYQSQSIAQGVKEAARRGVVADFDPACGGSAGEQLACQAQDYIGLGSGVTVVVSSGGEVGDELMVCAETQLSSVTGLLGPFIDDKVLSSSVTMRVEQETAGGINHTTGTADRCAS